MLGWLNTPYYKVQASKPSGYRFGLSLNVSIFNLNQYCKLRIEFRFYILNRLPIPLHPLQYTLYDSSTAELQLLGSFA